MKRINIRWNPVFKNEMRLQTRTLRFPMLVFLYNALLAFVSLLVYYSSFRNASRVEYGGILAVYGTIVTLEFVMIAFCVPSFCAGSISGERERQTLELLLSTKTKPIQIVLGKMASSISGVLILVLSSLPTIAIVFSIGGVYVKDLVKMVALAVVTAIYLGSVSVYFSSKFKKTILASFLSYGMVFIMTVGSYIFLNVMLLFWSLRAVNSNVLYGQDPNLGNMVLILLLNPIFTILAAMQNQFEVAEVLGAYVMRMGKTNQFIIKHWFYFSVLAQMLVSAFLLWRAASNLNPLKGKGLFRK